MKLWKVLGLAGLAGVAATGVIIAREQRQRAQMAPEEVRARLHARLEHAVADPEPAADPTRDTAPQRWRRVRRLLHRDAQATDARPGGR